MRHAAVDLCEGMRGAVSPRDGWTQDDWGLWSVSVYDNDKHVVGTLVPVQSARADRDCSWTAMLGGNSWELVPGSICLYYRNKQMYGP